MSTKIQLPVAILTVWDGDGTGFVDDELDTLGITLDPDSPGVAWLELSRQDGPRVRIRATRQLCIVVESVLTTARALAALDEPTATNNHAS